MSKEDSWFKPLTSTQKQFQEAIQEVSLVFVNGPAGVGKTFIACLEAAKRLKERSIRRILVTRPTVPISRTLGFLPGTTEEKLAPWAKPVLWILEDIMTPRDLQNSLRNLEIEFIPFETLRGLTFDDAFVILDEAQNVTPEEIKAFLTRIGERSKVVVNGDLLQSDLRGNNGLKFALDVLKDSEELQRLCRSVEFSENDVVRSGLCKAWVKAFKESS